MSGVGDALGFSRKANPQAPALDAFTGILQQKANDPNGGLATLNYKNMANMGMGNVLAGIAQTKGIRPSAAATMADIAGSRIQGQTAQNAGVMGLQEQQQNQNMLGNLLMNKFQMEQQAQQDQNNRLNNTFWKGVSGFGSALSGGGAM